VTRAASLIIGLSLLVLSCARQSDSDLVARVGGVEPFVHRARVELRAIAEDLRTAVLARDTAALLRYTWQNSEIGPGGGHDPKYDKMQARLQDPTSETYCAIFDTVCLRERTADRADYPWNRISIRDFMSSAPNLEIRIMFYPDEHRQDDFRGLGMILYVKPGVPGPVATSPGATYLTEGWGKTYVGLELHATRTRGWKYAHPSMFMVGCPGFHRC